MQEIPAGEFSANVDDPDTETTEAVRTLPAFWIDRTEVTREAFEVYDDLETLTGDAAVKVPSGKTPPPPGLPAVGINYITALAYCEYMGKTIPTIDQWQKAYRGGLKLPSGDNPAPKRGTPWGKDISPPPANLMRPTPTIAPVGSFPGDLSPYGIQDLAGNVSEWSRTLHVRSDLRGLRIVLGAQFDTSPERARHPILWRNSRPDPYFDYGLGVRCVSVDASDD